VSSRVQYKRDQIPLPPHLLASTLDHSNTSCNILIPSLYLTSKYILTMRALRQPQLRKDIIQNCVNCTANSNSNTSSPIPESMLNPDILEERLFNSAFHRPGSSSSASSSSSYPFQQNRLLSTLSRSGNSTNVVSPAQMERMKAYVGKSPLQATRMSQSHASMSTILNELDRLAI
jgi:hypothetical protein